MEKTITIEKDIHVRDKYGVRRQAFIAGTQVEPHVYNAILRSNQIVGEDPQKLSDLKVGTAPFQPVPEPSAHAAEVVKEAVPAKVEAKAEIPKAEKAGDEPAEPSAKSGTVTQKGNSK